MMDEMWNIVEVYGEPPEIERFKMQSLSPFPDERVKICSAGFDRNRVFYIGTDSEFVETWNFRESRFQEFGSYRFCFDTHTWFPASIFDRLAELFPELAFECDCIADNDDCMGFGWFNPPPGGEKFRADYAVPKGYWTNGGEKRGPEAARQHLARVANLRLALREAEAGCD